MRKCRLWLWDRSTYWYFRGSTVRLWDRSTYWYFKGSTVRLWDRSTYWYFRGSTVRLWDRSTYWYFRGSTVRLWDRSTYCGSNRLQIVSSLRCQQCSKGKCFDTFIEMFLSTLKKYWWKHLRFFLTVKEFYGLGAIKWIWRNKFESLIQIPTKSLSLNRWFKFEPTFASSVT